MGLYNDVVLPRAINVMCGSASFAPVRAPLVARARGTVLELGFGSGTNLPYYPAEVESVLAVEPSRTSRRLAAERIADAKIPVEFVELAGDRILAESASCDTAVTAFTLCSVPDPVATLREVARILRPGAELLLAEHGLAPGVTMARSQRALEPIQRRLAGGCHLTRDPLVLLSAVEELEVVSSEQRYLGGASPWGYLTRATVRRN